MSSTTVRLFWRYAFVATLRRRGAQLIQFPQDLEGQNDMQAVNIYPEEQGAAQPDMPRSIALFDFSHAINVAFNSAGPDSTAKLVIGWLRALRSSCDRVVLCLDTKPYRRTAIHDGYKAGRRPDPELLNIWDRVLEQVTAEGYAVARAANEEADDVMATLARIYSEDYACDDVRLVTADKDVSQCINKHVRWFVPQLGNHDEFEIRDEAWMLAHWGNQDWAARTKAPKQGPTPAQVPLVLAIMGDTSDKIPGVQGIGVVQAVGLVQTFKTTAAITEAAAAAINAAKVEGKKPSALWENWLKGMVNVPTWLALTTVNDDVQLDKHPLKYLEHVEPTALVAEGSFADELDEDPRGDAWEPSADELEEERRAMAASLPVGPGPLAIPSEPDRDPAERRAAMAAEADRVLPMPPIHDPSKMIVGKDPKADEALRELAAKLPPNALAGKPGSTSASSTPPATAHPAPTDAAPKAAPSAAGSAPSPSAATPRGDAPVQLTDQLREWCKSHGVYRAPETLSPHEREIVRLWSAEQENERAAADPKDARSPSAANDAASPDTASSSHVVPHTQGPPKQKRGDVIRSPQATDIVVAPPPNWALATQPRTANEMLDVAAVLYNSQFYQQFGSFRGVYAVMSIGRELGMGYAESLEAFHIVKDRPYPKAKWILSRCQKHPDFEWFIVAESTDKRCVIRAKHKRIDQILEFVYTIEEATQQGHTTGPNRDNWKKSPRSMLRARAITGAASEWCPGAAYAMPSAEEAEDYEDGRR